MRLFVDAIKDGIATCLTGEDESITVNLPIACLPDGIAEGMLMQFIVEIVEKSPQNEHEEINELFRALSSPSDDE